VCLWQNELKPELQYKCLKYGEVISGSVRRGYIKDTHVENGSKYLLILHCIDPYFAQQNQFFFNFEVSVFADNNRTEYLHCGKINNRHTKTDQIA